jgi:hypothetical protein
MKIGLGFSKQLDNAQGTLRQREQDSIWDRSITEAACVEAVGGHPTQH